MPTSLSLYRRQFRLVDRRAVKRIRRDFLNQLSTGLGGIALANLLHDDGMLAAEPIRPRIVPAQP